jgi:hypothetical protein
MQDFINKIASLQAFLKVLTWIKIVQLILILCMVAVLAAAFENQDFIYNYVTKNRIEKNSASIVKISKSSMSEVDAAIRKSNIIVGIQVSGIDFQKNINGQIYIAIDDISFKNWYNYYLQSSSDIPLFDSDIVHNRHTIDLINGEFVCYPVSESFIIKVAPDINKYVDTMCVVSIPPYYGKIVGSITVYTKKRPNEEEVYQIRNIIKALALNLYNREVK